MIDKKVKTIDWQDIEDGLFDGTESEMDELKCPNCGESIVWTFWETAKTLEYGCTKCNTYSRLSKVFTIPNCASMNQSKKL